jgi:hypothetical protein
MPQVLGSVSTAEDSRHHFRIRSSSSVHGGARIQEDAVSSTQDRPADDRDFLDRIVAWEQGSLSVADTLALFQELVSSGLAWSSSGAVKRTAALMIHDGRIHP